MGRGKEAPSVIPKHLHLMCDPCTHKRAAYKVTNDKRAFI